MLYQIILQLVINNFVTDLLMHGERQLVIQQWQDA
jgi:hypothetical protein